MTKSATKTAAAMSLALMIFIGANCFAVNPYFNAAGSSAAFNSFALAAGPANGGGVCGGFIWTKKNGAQGVDNRGTGLLETGNVWIVWDNSTNPTIVCSYIAVDSIIGQQLFFASPASTFNILFPAGTAGDNLIPTFTDTAIPQAVINVLKVNRSMPRPQTSAQRTLCSKRPAFWLPWIPSITTALATVLARSELRF